MVDQIRNFINLAFDTNLQNVSDAIIIAMAVVLGLIVIMSIVALVVQIVLSIKYVKYNRKQNSLKMSGENIARKILDENDLKNIKVKSSGSMLFGNSYSHYFKKVRLRRRTWKKDSVSSLAMAAQKSCLAILDKENDPDMQKRIRLTPFIYAGPFMLIPLVIVGLVIDLLIFKSNTATFTIVLSVIGIIFYLASFVMSLLVLKTEKKAQQRACQLLQKQKMATDEEIGMLEQLFKLYNIEYINNMIIALLELIYRILELIATIEDNK